MKQSLFEIVENTALTRDVYKMVLVGDTSAITSSGQFVNIQLDGLYLRRPISVCDCEGDGLTLLYKVVGKGTEQMSKMSNGKLDVLTGLGNGYDLSKSGERPLLIGGGVGVPPLYMLCKKLVVTTVDGSYGIKGFVTEATKEIDYTYFYTCGPEPMLKAIYSASKTSGQFSFEERMGCGFGACMGCSCKTVTGYKRICKEGPVLEKEEILWEK